MNKNHYYIYTTNLLFLFFCLSCILSCKDQGNKKDLFRVENNTSTGRDSWQKPELFISTLGDIKDKTIVDIGAGTGYFTFRLAFSANKVISVEIDPDMTDLIELFRSNLPQEIKSKIETRLVKPDDPGITLGEADIAVIINTISYIENPIEYLKKLHDLLPAGGFISIVDFKLKYLTIQAPPKEERIAPETVRGYLNNAGFKNITINNETLNFQYIIKAEVEG